MKLFKKLREYCETIYEEPMAVLIFSLVMSSAITFSLGGMVREGVIPWYYMLVTPLGLSMVFIPMYLMGRRWTKIDKK